MSGFATTVTFPTPPKEKLAGTSPSKSSKVENPSNTDVLLEICEKYFSDEEYEKAFSLLLDNYYKNKDIIKKKLLEFFEALGNDHDATKTYRKKLSSLLFK